MQKTDQVLRILHVMVGLNKAGTERLVLSLAKKQVKDGHVVKILAFTDKNHFPELTEGLDVSYTSENTFVNRLIRKPIKNTHHFEHLVRTFKPNIIHSHSIWVDWVVHHCYHPAIKYISQFHVYDLLMSNENRSLYSSFFRQIDKIKILRLYKKHQSSFIVVSNDMLNFYQKAFPKELSKKINVIKNGIELELFQPRLDHMPSFPLRLITVGRLSPVKNLTYLIEVVKLLNEKETVFLDIYGRGELEDQLEQEISLSGLHQKIRLMGTAEDLNKRYGDYDFYVHSALEEPFGLSLMEAMACGLPTISLAAGGNTDFIENHINGILLPKETNARKFAEALIQCAQDKKVYQRYVEKSIETSSEYSIKNVARQVYEVYRS